MTSAGILSVGVYLPPVVRGNDWWPSDVVASWMAQRHQARAGAPAPPTPTTPGIARVIAAMAAQADDPFSGARHRHVMPDGMTSADMELAAATQAMEKAGIDRRDIDLLLVHTAVPEYLMSNTASVLHDRLGLAPACLSMQTEAAAYSFLGQLTLARHMLEAGAARCALLVQSSGVSRLLDPSDPVSPLFGDAATAVVVGLVGAGRGILASVHRTEGRFPRTLIASVRGGRWYDPGPVTLHSADTGQAREVFLGILDRAHQVIDEVLTLGNHRADEVDLFASHQGTSWLRHEVQERVGANAARSEEVFATTGNVFSAMIPLGLRTAAPGDLVLMFGGGTGQTFGATLMRWGRS